MLLRKVEKELLEWKANKNHKPLVVKGLRQSGKTYSVKKFAKENYKNVVYINFQENDDFKNIFAESLEIDNLTYQMSIYIKDVRFEKNETVIILDEIQECDRARLALKFFKIDGRYDVIATGSFIGISGYDKKDVESDLSIPVGYEEELIMYPLDFEEFLWANKITDEQIFGLKKYIVNLEVIPVAIHNKFRDLLLKYLIVGGLPEVVQTFVDSANVNVVNSLKKNILSSFRIDMIKYVKGNDKTKVRDCFESIPAQLAKDNKKFKYSLVKSKATRTYYESTLQWLEDYGIINKCYNLSNLELPLKANIEYDKFKIYISDIGLLVSMLEEDSYKDILKGNLGIFNGAIYENLFADMMIKKSKGLYYYSRQSSLEIDFVTKIDSELTLIEVKATTGNAKSLKTVIKDKRKYNVNKAYKFGDYNVGEKDGIITLPFYLAPFINSL